MYKVSTDCGEERPVMGYCQNGRGPRLCLEMKVFMGYDHDLISCMTAEYAYHILKCAYMVKQSSNNSTLNTIYNTKNVWRWS